MTYPRSVIFDFDGVLVDSLNVHLQSWDDATFTLLGKVVEPELRKSIVGRSTREISQLIAGQAGQPSMAATLAQLKRARLEVHRRAIPLLPGVRECFAELTARSIPFAIGSNATREFISYVMSMHGISEPVVVGVEDVVTPKPSPEIFLKCAKILGINFSDHEKILVFEDSRYGIRAAAAAGMLPIGVATQHPDIELFESGAKAVCKDLQDALSRGFFTPSLAAT
jgi:beta-phosphoglucomutase